jgi:pimeloyl-ACP methyl ester carboxylesterase
MRNSSYKLTGSLGLRYNVIRVMRTLYKYLLLIVVLILAGMLYEQTAERRDRVRYLQMGRSVDIGGRSLNILCSGNGDPTVIFEGAGHTAGYAWINIQAEVAKFTRACWYDRAGYGWSDSAPSPRTFRTIANDLHTLLKTVAVPGPYVLVGATAGAFHVRVFNGLYPNEVAGAVLIHADDPDVFDHEPAYMKGALGSLPPWVQRAGCTVGPVMARIGLVRLLGNPGAGRPFGAANLTPEQQLELLFLSNNPRTAKTEGEGCTLEQSVAEVRAAGNFGGSPARRPYRRKTVSLTRSQIPGSHRRSE